MTTEEIATKLIAYCRKAAWEEAHTQLYAQDAMSIEPYGTPDYQKETQGLDAIRKKAEQFNSSVETYHSIHCSEPLVAGNSIAFVMEMDMTIKNKGRMKSPELCVYQVKDGKIISEQFFV